MLQPTPNLGLHRETINNEPNLIINDNYSSIVKKMLYKLERSKTRYLTRDKTIQCQECIYRYMCSDNRIPKKVKKQDLYDFDTECATRKIL